MPLISIIIPTHNRTVYAIKAIESALALNECVEVVVTDTSDVDNISHHFIQHECRERLNYVKVNTPLNVVENFSLGLKHAKGEYLLFIGDDDFVTSDIVKVACWAKYKKVDSVKFSFPVSYFWPDFEHQVHKDKFSGVIELSNFTGKARKHDSGSCLDYCLKNLGTGPNEMPRAYLGMFSKDLADKIIKKYGAVFGGVSPDIYSAAMISKEADSCYFIDFPIVVPGSSGASTSGLSAAGKHIGGLRDNPHIGAFKELKWDKLIPEFYSVQTVWSFSLLKAAELQKGSMDKLSLTRLYIKCFLYQRHYWQHTLSAFKEYLSTVGKVKGVLQIVSSAFNELFWICGKVFQKYIKKNQKYKSVFLSEIPDVVKANEELESYLAKNSCIQLKLNQ